MRGGAARFRPDTKSGGSGCCPLQARYEKRGGGGGCCPFKARYEKQRGGGGGCCPALQTRYKKRGRGRGCLAEEGALPYMKGGVATPKTPPPPPPPPPLDPPLTLVYLLAGLRVSRTSTVTLSITTQAKTSASGYREVRIHGRERTNAELAYIP